MIICFVEWIVVTFSFCLQTHAHECKIVDPSNSIQKIVLAWLENAACQRAPPVTMLGLLRRRHGSTIEVLRFHFLVDPDPEPESHPKEPELESLGSGSVLESDPP